MFWSKLAREYELQRELDGYAAEIEEMIGSLLPTKDGHSPSASSLNGTTGARGSGIFRSSAARFWIMPAATVTTGFAPSKAWAGTDVPNPTAALLR